MSPAETNPVDTRVIRDLWEIICERAAHPDETSYTSRLLRDKKGIDKVLEKVGEESTEFIIAIKNGIPERTYRRGSRSPLPYARCAPRCGGRAGRRHAGV